MCVASAAAAPPDEPPALRDGSNGFLVVPYTRLNEWDPAPNSGVFVLPIGTAPAAAIRPTSRLSALGRIRYVLLPAALPGYLGGLRQGWAFAWRSLMAAELITYSPSLGQGLGQLLNIGRELSQMSLVITSITLILVVGVAIELLVFAPLERRVLVRRGLTIR